MNDSLQCLVNTKAALDLGLVTEQDYEVVKASFLRAQQLRAALDSGMVSQEDFDANKGDYLASLSLQDTPAAAPIAPTKSNVSTPRSATASPRIVPTNGAPRPQPAEPVVRPPRPPSSAGLPTPTAAPVEAAPAAGDVRSSSGLPIPTNLSKIPGSKAPSAGTSMSGIAVTPDAVNLYYHMRSKSAYKWALWKLDAKGTSVVISDVGEPGSTFQDFLAALPENDCRYGVFDYQFTANDGNIMNKLVFFNWAPETAKVKARMMYASTKDFFKSHMDGISAEFQSSCLDEISEDVVSDAVKALKR